MNPRFILHECQRRGIVIHSEGTELRLRGPADLLAGGFLECVREHKAGLVELLTSLPGFSPPAPRIWPGFSPPAEQGGLNDGVEPDDASREATMGRGEEEIEILEFSPFSPLSPPSKPRDILARTKFSPPGEASKNLRLEGRENNNFSVRPPIYQESGLSGLTGLEAPSEDWRWTVAAWPHDRWTRWRRMVDQLVSRETNPTAETIKQADRVAYEAIRVEADPFTMTATR